MMNSATSTEPQSLQPWQLFALAGLVGATVVVFLSRGETRAGVVLLSLTIFAASAAAVATLRMFLPLAGRNEPGAPRMVAGRTRAALEREKALVLRSIKELEFDRAMGKVSDRDFAEMSGRLRARAVRLMRQLDAGADYRDQIDKEVAQRLSTQGAGEDESEAENVPRVTGPSLCACGTGNDPDAKFCKNCGAKLEAA